LMFSTRSTVNPDQEEAVDEKRRARSEKINFADDALAETDALLDQASALTA
jgi:hypothetical protein